MANDKKILGRAWVNVDGESLATLPGAKLKPGGVERTPVVLENGEVCYTEKLVHAEIEVEVAVGADTDIIKYNKITSAKVTFKCDTGQIYIMRNGFNTAPVDLSAGDGKGALKFAGQAVVQG